MVLAIDVGNTQTVYGLWDGKTWSHTWRRKTDREDTEDELGAWLLIMLERVGIAASDVREVLIASVVPPLHFALERLSTRYFSVSARFLTATSVPSLTVVYDPPTAVGADRIANAIGALALYAPPVIVVDFGTATTFDAIDQEGRYVGGAILPGIEVSAAALTARAAKLPTVELKTPAFAVGTSTALSIQSGLMFGYAGAIDALARRIAAELGEGTRVIATGGLGSTFLGLCETLESYEPNLTLDGLRLALL